MSEWAAWRSHIMVRFSGFEGCAGLYLVMKCPMVYERVGGLAASARAVLRRSAVYGSLVPPGDPGLLESGNACSICQACGPSHMPNLAGSTHVVTGLLWCHRFTPGARTWGQVAFGFATVFRMRTAPPS